MMSSSGGGGGFSSSLAIPCLPASSPLAPTPRPMVLPLMPHQQRALHRCLLIEQDGSLSTGFNALPRGWGEYESRGGVLADAVGTGKTATALALILSSTRGDSGSTLVVAPGHLIPQWTAEVQKFAPSIEVIVGAEAHRHAGPVPPKARRIVLVDIDTILNSESVHYDLQYRQALISRLGRAKTQEIREAARFCVSSPRGPCSYAGAVYTSALHMPKVPWRRVIFDEIQDLIEDGTASQKNLVQLSRKAENVWLMSATPFPHGNRSVEGNHEILGFKRLRLDVEGAGRLGSSHPFEKIKAKLYIRSPQCVADEAVESTQTVARQTEVVAPREIEQNFYRLELAKARETQTTEERTEGLGAFGPSFQTLREMTVHPEASSALREQLGKHRNSSSSSTVVRTANSNNDRVGRYASVDSFARSSLSAARTRLRQLEASAGGPRPLRDIKDTTRSLEVADKVKTFRASTPRVTNPFAAAGPAGSADSEVDRTMLEKEAAVVHDYYCACPRNDGPYACVRADGNAALRVVRERDASSGRPIGNEFLRGSIRDVISYFATECEVGKVREFEDGRTSDALEHYIYSTRRALEGKKQALEAYKKEKGTLETQIRVLSDTIKSSASDGQHDPIAAAHGSKPAALVRFLQGHADDKVIVFSMWHDTLRLVLLTLRKCGIEAVFCDGSADQVQRAIQSFTKGTANVILLSARAKASGANLQCASHVVFLDPPGNHADHGATLEKQAIGRAVRMGQEKAVTVTRFCVEGTIEAELYAQIDRATERLTKRANDLGYVIEGADKSLARQVTIDSESSSNDEDENGADDGVSLLESVTADELRKRRWEEAKATGAIIDVEDEEAKAPKSTPSRKEGVAVSSKKPKLVCASGGCVKVEDTEAPSSSADSPQPGKGTNAQTATVSPDGATSATSPEIVVID